jgi:hypothetical protein
VQEKHLTKLTPTHDQTLSKLRIEEDFLNLTKNICKNLQPTSHQWQETPSFPQGEEQGMDCLLDLILELLASEIM